MTKSDKELIELKFKGVYEHAAANFDLMHTKLEQIHDETKRTNGKVSKIEDETQTVRFMSTHPKIFAIIIVLFLGVLKIDYIITLITKLF